MCILRSLCHHALIADTSLWVREMGWTRTSTKHRWFIKNVSVFGNRYRYREKNHMQKFFFFGEKWGWWQWDRDSVAKFKKCCFSDETEPSWVRIRPVNHDQEICQWHWELRKSRATRGLVALVNLKSCANTEILWLWVGHWWKTSWPWPASAWCHRCLA